MRQLKWALAVPLALSLGVAGCASDRPNYSSNPQQPYYGGSYPQSSAQAQTGYVDRIEVVNRNSSSNIAGTVIGGIVGGLIGTQIGSGSGRTAATIAGAAGGAIAGNAIEGRRRADNETFRVGVRLDNGAYQTVTQENISDLRTGD